MGQDARRIAQDGTRDTCSFNRRGCIFRGPIRIYLGNLCSLSAHATPEGAQEPTQTPRTPERTCLAGWSQVWSQAVRSFFTATARSCSCSVNAVYGVLGVRAKGK